MRISPWRLALTGGAIIILAVAGIGLVAATSQPAATQTTSAQAAPTADPNASAAPSGDHRPGLRRGLRFGGLHRLAFGRHLVHASVTVQDKDGNLINLQFDHGTINAIGGGSITISEAGGGSVTVHTDADTKVRVGREAGSLSDLKVGDEIFVQSRIDGSTLAKHVRKVPASSGG